MSILCALGIPWSGMLRCGMFLSQKSSPCELVRKSAEKWNQGSFTAPGLGGYRAPEAQPKADMRFRTLNQPHFHLESDPGERLIPAPRGSSHSEKPQLEVAGAGTAGLATSSCSFPQAALFYLCPSQSGALGSIHPPWHRMIWYLGSKQPALAVPSGMGSVWGASGAGCTSLELGSVGWELCGVRRVDPASPRAIPLSCCWQ